MGFLHCRKILSLQLMYPLSKVIQRKVEVATGQWQKMTRELPHARMRVDRGTHLCETQPSVVFQA